MKKITAKLAVELLIERAVSTEKSEDALRFTQAARNISDIITDLKTVQKS